MAKIIYAIITTIILLGIVFVFIVSDPISWFPQCVERATVCQIEETGFRYDVILKTVMLHTYYVDVDCNTDYDRETEKCVKWERVNG